MSQGQKNFNSNDDNSPSEDILQFIDDLAEKDMFKSIVEAGGGGGTSLLPGKDASEKNPNATSNESLNPNQIDTNKKRF